MTTEAQSCAARLGSDDGHYPFVDTESGGRHAGGHPRKPLY